MLFESDKVSAVLHGILFLRQLDAQTHADSSTLLCVLQRSGHTNLNALSSWPAVHALPADVTPVILHVVAVHWAACDLIALLQCLLLSCT